jgi:plastocyanin
VKLLSRNAPAHAIPACVGAFVLSVSIAACGDAPRLGGGGDRTLELNADTITLAAGTNLHDIRIRSGKDGDFSPAAVTARGKDVIRLTTADTRTHALTITAPTTQAGIELEAKGQHRSPPLVARGQSWVLSVEGLPAGTYTVTCLSHAGTATIQVE